MSSEKRQAVTPQLTVSSASDACDYYAKYMNATIVAKYPSPDGRLLHAEIKLPNGATIYLNDDFPEYGLGSELDKNGQAHASASIALYFETYKQGLSFWNNFHHSDNIKHIKDDCTFEPQFWGDNYGRFQCKFGHIWSLSAPLDKDQKMPPSPFVTETETNKQGTKRSSMMDDNQTDQTNDEPPKKKQKLSSNTTNNTKNANNANNEEMKEQSGFKEVINNVSEQYGLFMDFENVALVSSAMNESKDGLSKVLAAGQAYGAIWGFVSNNFKDGNPTTSAVAVCKNGPEIKPIDSYMPGFLFDTKKVSKNEIETKLGQFENSNENKMKLASSGSSDWYVYLHIGSYDNLPQAWTDARNDLKSKGLEIKDIGNNKYTFIAYELYLNEPSQTKESELKTELYIAVKSAQ